MARRQRCPTIRFASAAGVRRLDGGRARSDEHRERQQHQRQHSGLRASRDLNSEKVRQEKSVQIASIAGFTGSSTIDESTERARAPARRWRPRCRGSAARRSGSPRTDGRTATATRTTHPCRNRGAHEGIHDREDHHRHCRQRKREEQAGTGNLGGLAQEPENGDANRSAHAKRHDVEDTDIPLQSAGGCASGLLRDVGLWLIAMPVASKRPPRSKGPEPINARAGNCSPK